MRAGWVGMAGDCNDTNAGIHPGAREVCNGVDDDCIAPTDPPTCLCTGTATDPRHVCGYSSDAATRCAEVTGTCVSGAWVCPPGLITGGELETCDGVDNNCNGGIDEGLCALDGQFCDAGVGGCVCRPGYTLCGVSCQGNTDSTQGRPCADGLGSCRRTGSWVCGGDGIVRCDAVAATPYCWNGEACSTCAGAPPELAATWSCVDGCTGTPTGSARERATRLPARARTGFTRSRRGATR